MDRTCRILLFRHKKGTPQKKLKKEGELRLEKSYPHEGRKEYFANVRGHDKSEKGKPEEKKAVDASRRSSRGD